jgi:hypothetical protein
MAVHIRAAARRGTVLPRVAATGDIHSCVMRNNFSNEAAQKIHFDL